MNGSTKLQYLILLLQICFHSKLKRPDWFWRVVVLPATLAATAIATCRSLWICYVLDRRIV